MITIFLIMLYVGGVIGIIKSAPSGFSPGHVLLNSFLCPAVIVSILVEKFICEHATWAKDSKGPEFSKK